MTQPLWINGRRSLLTLLLVGVWWAGTIVPVGAQGNLVQRIRALFDTSDTIGQTRTGRRRGAATRDPDLCAAPGRSRLTALAPDRDTPIQTSAAHPTFWFYLPYALNPPAEPSTESSITLKFVLKDDADTILYETAFMPPASPTAGIVSLRLTAEPASLEVNRTYRWYVLVYCNDPQQIYEPAMIEGQIQRIPLEGDRARQLNEAEAEQRFLFYAEARLWYDMLTALAEARQTNPTNSQLREAWAQVLQGVNLGELSDTPIVARYRLLPNQAEARRTPATGTN